MEGASSAEWPAFPFCSARCRLIDLGRWLGEDYAVGIEASDKDRAASVDEESIP
jgi:hypothetical protein